jgi:hypothetical protein
VYGDKIDPVQQLSSDEGTPLFPDFLPWFSSVVEEVTPAIVVGIARGAIRVLELTRADTLLKGIALISNHALPFLSDSEIEGKRILLFDDSIIFGSTMNEVRNYLLKRRAIVSCAAYVADRTSFLGELEPGQVGMVFPSSHVRMPIRIKHRLWPSAVRRHHSSVISALLRTPSHYNLDFPTISVKLSSFASSEIPYIWGQRGTFLSK